MMAFPQGTMAYPRGGPRRQLSRAIAAARNGSHNQSFVLWGCFFVVVTVAAWLVGTMDLLWLSASSVASQESSPPSSFHQGGRVHKTTSVLGATGDSMRFTEILVVEAVWFGLGFVALCLAALCFSVEACGVARKRTDDYWAKYCKAV